ncbi:MAG TPA: CPBP family intramembrane glutamic endopeptidase [Mycobacteriales bacterium]|nr:CPBP family intramembrane glutamic endopeptidase [Mycobacteriales bacterium]
MASAVALSGPVLVLALIVAGYLVVVQPVVGRWSQARFERAVRDDPGARLARYRRTMRLEWCLLAVVLALVAAAPEMDLADIGVRPPGLTGGAAPFTVIGTVGLVLSAGLLSLLRSRLRRGRVAVAGPPRVVALLPRTAAERTAFGRLAVTAGVCEEVLYRGFLLAVVVALVPGLAPWGAVLVAVFGFGAAHAYQGAGGVLATGVLGGCLAILFLGSGSLLLPVLFHVLVDLRALLLSAAGPRHAAS